MSFLRGFDGSDSTRAEPLTSGPGLYEERRSTRSGHIAFGTLACRVCDAPVAPAGPMSPADPLACPFCDHLATVRDFLSLSPPTRPARVEVRIRRRARP